MLGGSPRARLWMLSPSCQPGSPFSSNTTVRTPSLGVPLAAAALPFALACHCAVTRPI